MLDQNDREEIVTVIWEMMREEITQPLTQLMDCLVFELISQNSIDTVQLEQRLSSLWEGMTDQQRDTQGSKLFHRYLRVFQSMNSDPESWIEFLASAGCSAEGSQTTVPDWFRGVIEGKPPRDSDS